MLDLVLPSLCVRKLFLYVGNRDVILIVVQVPAALMNVVEEKSMKDSRKVDPYYFLFFSCLYQFIFVVLLFWTDIIPGFGYTSNIHEFGRKCVVLTATLSIKAKEFA